MTSFWSGWIIAITTLTIVGCAILLVGNRKIDNPGQTTGHSYDGIQEYDNPLPGWWFWLFVGTIVFSAVYLALYPGMGNFKGTLGWTSTNQWEREIQAAEEKYGPLFAKYANMPIEDVAKDEQANKMGQRMFANNCAVCHGSDAKGSFGFPNLTDKDWLYGGSPEQIKHSITKGRNGAMPAKGLKPDLTVEQVSDISHYVISLSREASDTEAASRGQALYVQACAACHMPTGTGNQGMGAPNLADKTWLYGGTHSMISHTITNGRQAQMPAHEETLNSDKIHLLTAYVYSLSM